MSPRCLARRLGESNVGDAHALGTYTARTSDGSNWLNPWFNHDVPSTSKASLSVLNFGHDGIHGRLPETFTRRQPWEIRLKILIVEDSDAMRAIIRRTLRRQGWSISIVEARDGKQAIQVFKRERPHLIITDWEMPTVSGIALLEAFKRNGITVPIGMITGHANDENRQRAIDAGAAFVLAKPFTSKDLRTCVRPFVEGRTPAAATEMMPHTDGKLHRKTADFLTEMVPTSVWVEHSEGCPPSGSAGVIFVLGIEEDQPSHVMIMDWPLINYLDAAFNNLGAGSASANIRYFRPTPAVLQTTLEIGNVFRSFLRSFEGLDDLVVQASAFRGDGKLREPFWTNLLSSESLSAAEHFPMRIIIGGFGQGDLSLYRVKL